jgi:archaellum component FlaF (FlaF/FlaG flagellin family)
MKHILPPLVILGVLLFALYQTQYKKTGKKPEKVSSTYLEHTREHKTSHIQEEIDRLHTDAYTKTYIVNVINHGSSQLHFKEKEVMEEGFVSKEDAPKVACYVLSLSGKKCKDPYPEDAAMFYTSVCGGCHGDDGKGLGGTYPDLTRKTLLGIAKREAFLKSLLQKK